MDLAVVLVSIFSVISLGLYIIERRRSKKLELLLLTQDREGIRNALKLDTRIIHDRINNAPIEELLSDGERIYNPDARE